MKIILAGGGRAGLSVAVHSPARPCSHADDKDGPSRRSRSRAWHRLPRRRWDPPRLLAEAEVHQVRTWSWRCCHVTPTNLAVAALSNAPAPAHHGAREEESYRASTPRPVSTDHPRRTCSSGAGHRDRARERAHLDVLGNGEAVAFELTVPTTHAAGRNVSSLARAKASELVCGRRHLRRDWQVKHLAAARWVDAGATILIVSRRSEISTVIDFFMKATRSARLRARQPVALRCNFSPNPLTA